MKIEVFLYKTPEVAVMEVDAKDEEDARRIVMERVKEGADYSFVESPTKHIIITHK
jgi:hypothetical protein